MKLTPRRYAESLVALASEKSEKEVEHVVQRLVQDFGKKGKVKFLTAIKKEIALLLKKQHRQFDATLRTAHHIPQKALAELKHTLEKKLDGSVTLDTHIDQSLIAGSILTVDDIMIDASLSSRLHALAARLSS